MTAKECIEEIFKSGSIEESDFRTIFNWENRTVIRCLSELGYLKERIIINLFNTDRGSSSIDDYVLEPMSAYMVIDNISNGSLYEGLSRRLVDEASFSISYIRADMIVDTDTSDTNGCISVVSSMEFRVLLIKLDDIELD